MKVVKNKQYIVALILSTILILAVATNSYAGELYRIQSGDSLFTIAQRFNTSISDLIRTNNISNPNIIYSGKALNLPSTAKKTSSSFYNINKVTSDTRKSSNSSFNTNYNNINWKSNNNVVIAEPKKENTAKKIYRKGPSTMKVALTFDDGPDPVYTPQVLDVLKKYNVKATFFLVGQRVEKNPSIVKRIYEEGHTIANHSWDHANLTTLDEFELEQNMTATDNSIKEIIKKRPELMRPPYGAVNSSTLEQLNNLGYKVIHWSVDSLDWKAKTKEEVLAKTLPDIHEGAIILFHSAGGKGQSLMPTINALPTIIETLQEKGIEMVTVDDLLLLSAYRR
ncbi:polysaccharide deacetylase family protein [Orenia metallireducens]|uniref:polysaccharide deacetylase family protein n=1 Tax=Orenia metallireducens TaxID=1413210 RepID=UPI003CCB765E